MVKAPTHSLRVVFALSAFACSVILMLFLRGRAVDSTEFWAQLLAAAAGLCALACLVAFRRGGLRLVEQPLWPLLRLWSLQLLYAYLITSALLTAIGWALLYAATRSAQSSLALSVLAGLWLSLWAAPGISCLGTWRKLRRQAKASSLEAQP
ncbi:MAG: hypothetical protein KBC73_15380 [Burkholderiaceae bacterium]|nr:hypothetical protein [Burkholderiaceae bacterium]